MIRKKHFYVVRLAVCFLFFCLTMMLPHTGSVSANVATSIQSQVQNADQNSCVITSTDLVGRYNLNYAGNTNYVTDWIAGANNGEPGGYRENTVYNDLDFPQYLNLSSYQNGVIQHDT